MTQDPWGQPWSGGHVVRGEVVPDSESGAPGAGQAPPMTHFQKVASALRGRSVRAARHPARTARRPGRGRGAHGRGRGARGRGGGGEQSRRRARLLGRRRGRAGGRARRGPRGRSRRGHGGQRERSGGRPETAPSAPPDVAEEEPGDQAGPDSHDATDPSMTQPNVFGTPRPTAASVPTVPIVLAEEPDGATGRHAASAAPADDGRCRRLRPVRLAEAAPAPAPSAEAAAAPARRLRRPRLSCDPASPGLRSASARAGTRA